MSTSTTHVKESYVLAEGLKVIEHFFEVPLNWAVPDGEKIRVFARQLVPKSKSDEKNAPYLVYLQGGPGFECTIDGSSPLHSPLHEKGYQTIWIDQRGTGLSTTVSPSTVPSHLKTDEELASYLKNFRGDNIIRDCEHIRRTLLGTRENPDDRKWTLMGQSWGGFLILQYLSFFPEAIKEAFITGGLGPFVDQPDEVYEALVHRVKKRNLIYYQKYPQDVKRVRDILAHLDQNKVTLPTGGTLSTSRFQEMGADFGMQGGIDRVHQIVFRAAQDLDQFGKLSHKTLQNIESQAFAFDGNPFYAVLHEAMCYCQGKAANWSADRVVKKHDSFSWQSMKVKSDENPVYFTGEMVFRSAFDDYANLRPWKGVADLIAKDDSWGRLYDYEQLAKNEVKVSAVTYYDDMYVDFDYAQKTAARVKNLEQYITNWYGHDGLRRDPKHITEKLFALSERIYL